MKRKCSKDESDLSPPRNREINKQCLILMVIVMNKGLSSVMFWKNNTVFTGNFTYPSSFGY
ncbi:hypothetical protein EXA13_13700 [Vibrio cincinnatiensis]|nr:hypothetical protein [Vibrio cincinnatiensis]